MQKKCAETGIVFILIMMLILPFCVFAAEQDNPKMGSNPPGPSQQITTDASGAENPVAVGASMRTGRKHRTPVYAPGLTRGNFKSRANHRRDGLVSKYEENQAKKGPDDGSFGDKAVNSAGQSTGKPAWMDNNPLTPATPDSQPDVTITPAHKTAHEAALAAKPETSGVIGDKKTTDPEDKPTS